MNQGYDINAPLTAANESAATNDSAMKTGMGLAQAMQDMKQKSIQTAEMEDKLAMGRAQSLVDRLTTQNKIGDERLRKTYAKQNDQWAQKNGLAYQGFFNDHAGDDAQTRLGPLGDLLMGSVKTPEQARAALAAASDPAMLDKTIGLLEEQKKQENAKAIAQVKANAQVTTGAGHDAAKVASTQPINDVREARLRLMANRQYTQEMKPSEDLLLASQKLQHIASDVDAGKLNSNKTIRSEVQAGIAQMLAGGKPSTVFGQQAVEQDSLFQEIKDFSNKYLGEAGGTVPPEQWNQLKKDIAALRTANADLHEKKYQSYREALEGAPIQGHLDSRYNKFRESMTLGGNATEGKPEGNPEAAPAASAPAASDWSAQYKDPVQQKFIQNALSHGYSQGEIEAKLKGK